jgi:hypothetical protein
MNVTCLKLCHVVFARDSFPLLQASPIFLVLTRSLVWSMLLWLDEVLQSWLDVSARWFKLLRRD